jgi:nucleoside-diphosphate-sugar epimerase
VHQIRRLLEAPRERVHRRTFYIGDPPIELLDYINGFSRRLAGRDVRQVPHALLKAVALAGDGLAALGFKRAPLTRYRLANMTADNVLDVSATLEITGPGPYSLDQGIERTVAWLDERL